MTDTIIISPASPYTPVNGQGWLASGVSAKTVGGGVSLESTKEIESPLFAKHLIKRGSATGPGPMLWDLGSTEPLEPVKIFEAAVSYTGVFSTGSHGAAFYLIPSVVRSPNAVDPNRTDYELTITIGKDDENPDTKTLVSRITGEPIPVSIPDLSITAEPVIQTGTYIDSQPIHLGAGPFAALLGKACELVSLLVMMVGPGTARLIITPVLPGLTCQVSEAATSSPVGIKGCDPATTTGGMIFGGGTVTGALG